MGLADRLRSSPLVAMARRGLGDGEGTWIVGGAVRDAAVGREVTDLDLQGQLEKGLKARRPVEFLYIAQIVDLVEKNKLPRDLVDSTFGWARKKRTKQLQYFQFALQARANALGFATPDLASQGIASF